MMTPELKILPHLLQDTDSKVDSHGFIGMIAANDLVLIKRWDLVKDWETAKREEIEHIQAEHGEHALKDGGSLRYKLLEKRTGRDGETWVVLTEAAEFSLRERVGTIGFRERKDMGEGTMAVFFVKRIRLSGGYAEVSFSWYDDAWMFSQEARTEHESSLNARNHDGDEHLGTRDEGGPMKRQPLHARLAAISDAGLIHRLAHMKVFLQKTNIVQISGIEFRDALGCENDPNWKQRVVSALHALTRLYFQVKMNGSEKMGKTEGVFLASFQEVRVKEGEQTDWIFILEIPRHALGSLALFVKGDEQLTKEGMREMQLDFGVKVSKEDYQESRLATFWTISPHLEHELQLTPSQAKLFYWLQRNLTLNKDGRKDGGLPIRSNFPGSNEVRVYTDGFCPVLPAGRKFIGALGHFKSVANPETGWKLKTILIEADRVIPKGHGENRRTLCRAGLDDLRRLVEAPPFDGIIAVFTANGEPPITLRVALTRYSPEELVERRLMPFYPADLRSRLRDYKNFRNRDRFGRGESFRSLEFTGDESAARANEAARMGEVVVLTDDGQVLLRRRLKDARKERGLTQAAAGRILGVSQVTISNWEAGIDRANIGARRLRGKPIPPAMIPRVERWIETGDATSLRKKLSARRAV